MNQCSRSHGLYRREISIERDVLGLIGVGASYLLVNFIVVLDLSLCHRNIVLLKNLTHKIVFFSVSHLGLNISCLDNITIQQLS